MALDPKTKTIILRSVAGLAVASAGIFGYVYFFKKDDDGKTKFQRSKERGSGGGGTGGGGKPPAGGSSVDTNVSTSDFPLEVGSRNKAVVLMQVALKHKWGQSLINVDGRFGTSTRDGILNKFYYLFGGSTSPTTANVWIRLPFTKFEITESNYNAIVKGVDFNKIFSQNPNYKQMFNQYQNFND